MAELLKKFKCKTTTGEIQELSVYTTLVEATNEGEARQVKVEVEPGNFMTGYIGLTKDFDTPKASGINFKNAEEHWKMRKYMGVKNFRNYMKNTYPDTYQTITELPDIPDTSDATDIGYICDACYEISDFSKIKDLRNASNISFGFYNCIKGEIFSDLITSEKLTNTGYLYYKTLLNRVPKMNTSSVNNASYMLSNAKIREYNDEYKFSKNVSLTQFLGNNPDLTNVKINTEQATGLGNLVINCGNLLRLEMTSTKICNSFGQLASGCKLLNYISPIDLSSLALDNINKNITNMLYNCNSLQSIVFNNVPIGVTEEQLRALIGAPSTCEIVINHRQLKEHSPIKIIKAENMKLVDIDTNSNISIVREGNKPLDEYIVNSGDWGTIYDDGKNFRCFITKDNLIYTGDAYNSTNRTEIQPEVPEGIEVPSTSIRLEKTNEQTFENNSFIFTDMILGGKGENRLFAQTWNGNYL